VRYFVLGWGSWTQESSSKAYNGTLTKFLSMRASTRGTLGYATFTFTGRDVAYVASLGRDRISATVKIDGVFFSTVNLYRSTSAGAQIVVSKHWATSGTHTIAVGSAGYGWIDVDAFVVNE
jgi:hypothetical protein